MYKVVLIDDEPLMIEGLMNMIEWNQYDFKVSGVAQEGEVGLELIKTIEPDLVITDIRMPGMSGLELVNRCRNEISAAIEFVIISGYNDFNYIKSAMNLYCSSYILKPIDQDEVHGLLFKIKTQLDAKKANLKKLDESIDVVTKMTINRLISDPLKQTVLSRAEFLMNWSSNSAFCYGAIYGNYEQNQQVINKLSEISHTIDGRFIVLDYLDRRTKFIFFGQEKVLLEWRNTVIDVVENSNLQVHAWLLLSHIGKNLSDLPKMAHVIHHNIALGYYQQCPIVQVGEEPFEYHNCMSMVDKFMLAEWVKTKSQDCIEHELACLLRTIRKKTPEPDFLYLCLENFLEYMEKQYETPFVYKEILHFSGFKETLSDALSFYKNIESRKSTQFDIEDVKDYIDTHYIEDVRLKEVAKLFGYNSVYLGQLFLKEFHVKYKDYVLSVRIKKAKELLLYTNLNIKEISLNIGFSNPDYFVHKFKSIEGISPSRYRV